MHRDGRQHEGRRRALRVLGAAGCGVLAGAAASVGCSGGQVARAQEQPVAQLPLSDLPLDGRVVVLLGGRPVEVRRTDSGVAARSLLCTHFGCRVAWNERESAYVCPCHHGRFDAAGRVVAGPPRLPLGEVPVRVEGETVVLGGDDPGRT